MCCVYTCNRDAYHIQQTHGRLLKTPYGDKVVIMMSEIEEGILPRLPGVRRVPERYRQLLPVAFMKRYQCVVVGATRRALTVAIADPSKVRVCHTISKLTGYATFPVLVEPEKVRLLVKRIERSSQVRYTLPYRSSAYQVYCRTMITTFTCLGERPHQFR